MAGPLPDAVTTSIVIPVLNEAGCLDRSLSRLFANAWVRDHCEIIVSDGGSSDASLEIAAGHRCSIVHSEAGRARQMNRGAAAARGDYLLFLHADSRLPADWSPGFEGTASWGFFRIRLDHPALAYRVIETAINLRSRLTRVAGGDQGLFFERAFFERLGRFAEIPLMEDIAICKQARRHARPLIISTPMSTSCRRWQQRGIVSTVVLMWLLRLAYWLGVDPDRLHRLYYPRREQENT